MVEMLVEPTSMTDRQLIAALVDVEDAMTYTKGSDPEGFYFWSAVAEQLFVELAVRA